MNAYKKSKFLRPFQDLKNVCAVAKGSTGVLEKYIAVAPCASLSQSAFDFCFCLQQVFYWGGGKQTPHKVDMFQGGHSALQVNIICFILNSKHYSPKHKFRENAFSNCQWHLKPPWYLSCPTHNPDMSHQAMFQSSTCRTTNSFYITMSSLEGSSNAPNCFKLQTQG